MFKDSLRLNQFINNEKTVAAFFLLPAIVLITTFMILPMVYAFWVSLHAWDGLSNMVWAGFGNYQDLLGDTKWFKTLGRTFIYTLLSVPILFIASLSLALIVRNIPNLSGLFRTLFFVPVIMSAVISGLVWSLIYDEKFGILNHLLGYLGIDQIAWLSDQVWAFIAVIIVSTWMHMGFFMIIFLAGLQDIPKLYYEAATIDGANKWQSFWNITFPNLRHTAIFVLVISVIRSFQVFDLVKLLTNGGPASATKFAVQHIFEAGFQLYDMGYASTLSISLFIIILLFTILQMKLLSADEE